METSEDTCEANEMKFWKYHGIGNDFILFDWIGNDIEIDKDRCKLLCDRNYGIGADGVLFLLSGDKADVGMRVINADGTEAEMCGNGIRCLAKHAYDFGVVDKTEFTIDTLAGIKTVKVALDADKVVTVRVDMGAPILDGRSIPIDHDGKFIDRQLKVDNLVIRGNAVSMGNPHFITFSDLDDGEVIRLGPILEKYKLFPKRTNVEFCRIEDGNIHIKVYERGAQWTLACGTGACASTVAAAVNGLVSFDEPVAVRLPGGWLTITVKKDLSHVYMEGPAELVYEGNISDE
ncbi:diaminopimelate epimerase [Candidatus Methanoplasma termitum]|uniref:Diaminopimelate epimerase n=1 Tax=Candidatus Methanoplasma termitum TaxID=1577791 RepID=A0A0A7LCG3_9ARCH|nr:diaminopimelate epimerase [Candidatus Methanoplasma termitum]AIZ55992.1 diaminopimelate epimerase [Candidatus Methanoplasma termitum]MCL2334168.1 diaminopimelate epimerase [Candidatus Methanoplasma sp.]